MKMFEKGEERDRERVIHGWTRGQKRLKNMKVIEHDGIMKGNCKRKLKKGTKAARKYDD